jgi:hypothetical protein
MTSEQQFALEIVKWLVMLSAVIAIPATVIGYVAFRNTTKGAAKTFSLLIQRGSIIRLAAIFAIIFCTFILCILGSLKPEIAASIFSGIAGYVLGGAPRGSDGGNSEDDTTG